MKNCEMTLLRSVYCKCVTLNIFDTSGIVIQGVVSSKFKRKTSILLAVILNATVKKMQHALGKSKLLFPNSNQKLKEYFLIFKSVIKRTHTSLYQIKKEDVKYLKQDFKKP